jgi:hypothetical protein
LSVRWKRSPKRQPHSPISDDAPKFEMLTGVAVLEDESFHRSDHGTPI